MTNSWTNYAVFLGFAINCLQTVIASPNVAIIGGGLGGVSCSVLLKKFFEDKIEITIYEQNRIGGRISTATHGSKDYETGGSIFHAKSKYISDLIDEFDLEVNIANVNENSAIYDGNKVEVIDGKSFKTLSKFVNDDFEKLNEIGEIQSYTGDSFKTVGELLKAIDPKFLEYTATSTEKLLNEKLGENKIIYDFAESSIRANYGQSVNAQALAGLISLSHSGISTDLLSVEGGNMKMVEELLKFSKSTISYTRISEVKRKGDRHILVSIDKDGNASENEFDYVVVATPFAENTNNIQFSNYEKSIKPLGKFHKTVATILEGDLNTSYFKTDEESLKNSNRIINISDDTFDSIEKIKSVKRADPEGNIWRILSQNPVPEKKLSELFYHPNVIKETEFLAYPEYNNFEQAAQASFVLSDHLYYLNAIEFAASSMEMSIVGAYNVALLIQEEESKK